MPRTTDEAARPEPARRPPEPLPLTINGKRYYHDGDPSMPLLWFLRDRLRLTGTRYGCDDRSCGACMVLVDGKATRACSLDMAEAATREVTTIEGLARDGLHPVQQAWIDADAVLCGYCQTGQIMAAVDLLARKPDPREDDLASLSNLCRCGAYPRIRKAVLLAAESLRERK